MIRCTFCMDACLIKICFLGAIIRFPFFGFAAALRACLALDALLWRPLVFPWVINRAEMQGYFNFLASLASRDVNHVTLTDNFRAQLVVSTSKMLRLQRAFCIGKVCNVFLKELNHLSLNAIIQRAYHDLVTLPGNKPITSSGPPGYSAVSGHRVTVFGVTGFLGRYFVSKLGLWSVTLPTNSPR